METAADVLRTARRRAGLTQRALAQIAGVRQPLISRIESGRQQPSVETLRRLVRACGYELFFELAALPDEHDLSLLSVTIPLTPEQRIDRLLTLHRTARELQKAVRVVEIAP